MKNIKDMSDAEILDIVNDATSRHITEAAKFKANHPDFDFTYPQFRNELIDRGYVQEWHKPNTEVAENLKVTPDVVNLVKDPTSEKVRKTFSLSKETAQAWDEFIKNKPMNSILVDTALKRLIADYNLGKIEFRL
jgi:hypothetical protein